MRKLEYRLPGANTGIIFGDASQTYNFTIETADGLDYPKFDIQDQKAPYQDGSTYIDALSQPREIEISGHINANQDFTLINTIRLWMGLMLDPKQGPGTILYTNATGTTYTATGIVDGGPIFKNKPFTEGMQPYKIRFICFDPYWYSSTQKTITLNSGNSWLADFTNAGAATPCEIWITGSITNYAVVEGGAYGTTPAQYLIGYVHAIGGAETIYINTQFGHKQALSGTTNVFKYIGIPAGEWPVQPSFFFIPSGHQYMTLETDDGTGFSATIKYYERWLAI